MVFPSQFEANNCGGKPVTVLLVAIQVVKVIGLSGLALYFLHYYFSKKANESLAIRFFTILFRLYSPIIFILWELDTAKDKNKSKNCKYFAVFHLQHDKF